MNSKRRYVVMVVEPATNTSAVVEEFRIDRIITPKENDWEYIYALGEIIDDVLDLGVLDVLPFQANRDNPKQKGVIIRKA
jgi:hypothetical protein